MPLFIKPESVIAITDPAVSSACIFPCNELPLKIAKGGNNMQQQSHSLTPFMLTIFGEILL